MKLTTSLFLLAASAVSASPTPSYKEAPAKALQKRATITDAANIGYATQNGGYAQRNLSTPHCADFCRTKGGAGGPTTTVSTLPQLSAAAAVSGPLIIVVQGAISGAAKVSVTSDKTIVGKAGSCESTPIHIFTMICSMNFTTTLITLILSLDWHRSHYLGPEERDRQEHENCQSPGGIR